jgi:YVTN family beta-propeller protein
VRSILVCIALTGCVTTTAVGDDDDGKNDQTDDRVRVVGEIDVGGEADWMGVGFGSLWVPTPDGQLLRIDPAALAVSARIPIGSGPYRGVAIGDDAIYIPNSGDDTISKIDPTTNAVVATLPATLGGDSEGSIGVSRGALWVTDASGVLNELDATTGAVLASGAVPADSHGVVVDRGCAWVTSAQTNTVTQVDLATATVLNTIGVDAGPRFLTAGEGSVWVLSQTTGTVTRIDSATGEKLATIDVHATGHGGDIAYGEDAIWVTTFGKPVGKIDPRTNKLVVQLAQDGFGDAIRAGFGKLWVSGEKVFAIAPP